MSSAYCKPPSAYDTQRREYGETPRNGIRAPLDGKAERLLQDHPQLRQLLSETIGRFPHVINMIAEAWIDPKAVLVLVDSLVLDDRPNRQGFPLETLVELSDLRLLAERRRNASQLSLPRPGKSTGPRRWTAGFTVVELLVVLAVISVLSVMVTPQVTALSAAQQVRVTALDLAADLTLARSEAVKRNTAVRVQPVEANWSLGWRVVVAGSDQELRRHKQSLVTFSGAPAFAEFGPGGRLSVPNGPLAIQLVSAGSGSVPARCVRVELSGTTRSLNQTC